MTDKAQPLSQMSSEKCETPDPPKPFNRIEYLKKYRQMKLANETPEEAIERRIKQREKARKRRQMTVQNETPEEADLRRLKQREKARRLRKIVTDKETPEQTTERLAKRRGFVKTQILLKTQAFENNSPGEVTPPFLSRNEYLKEYRILKRENETPEEAAERRLKQRERAKRLRRITAERETPEQAEKRRIKERTKNKMYQQLKKMKKAIETPEEAAKRLLKMKEYQKEQYRKRRAKETPEQAVARRLYHNRYRQEQRALLKQDDEKGGIQARLNKHAKFDDINDPIVKYENIDDEWDGSCTWSSFGASEGSYSRTSLEGSSSRTSTATRPQATEYYNSDAPSEGKSEPSQNNGFFFEISEFANIDTNCNETFGPAVVQDIIIKEEVDL